jgi:hypothetical protein
VRVPWRIVGIAAAVFLIALAARWPASWSRPFLPRSVVCAELSGTIWSGACAGLVVANGPIGDVQWNLEPAKLLRARLGGTVAVNQPLVRGSAAFESGFDGALRLTNVEASVSLEPALSRELPQDVSARVLVDLPLLELAHGRIRLIRGRLEARDLVQHVLPPLAFGAYEVRFDSPPQPNGDIVGVVRDLGGPVAFDGTLRLTQEPGYLIEGRVAARADAAPGLARQFEFLGRAAADGRRPLSIAGAY